MDRNGAVCANNHKRRLSLSARRAWIEMLVSLNVAVVPAVALRKESVDRNHAADMSARRKSVALRKESVDRNSTTPTRTPTGCGRSPQGERG